VLESPWEKEAGGDAMPAGKVCRAREQLPKDTCPWGAPDDAHSVKSARSKASGGSHNTCPWGDGGQGDRDTAALHRAERLKERPAPSREGFAGIGAPRSVQPQCDAHPAPQDSYAAQQDSSTASPPAQDTAGFAPTYDSDEDAKERALLIEKCLAHGLSDEEIEGVLREHLFQKEMEKMDKPERLGETMKPASTSVAAQRQAKAMAKNPSYGPSDEEIANVMHEHRTPSPQMPSDPAPRGRLGRKTDVTGKVGDLGATGSRNAYFDSQQAAAAAKDRNRVGHGIF